MFKMLLTLALCINSMSVFAEIDFESPSMICLTSTMEKDYEKALRSCTHAAEQGELFALENLGDMYYFGQGVNQDYKKAVINFTLAGEQGSLKAQSRLGFMYHYGIGIDANVKEAEKWFSVAAEQHGYNSIGHVFKFKYKDYEQSLKWYKLGAEKGDARAQYSLGDTYYRGSGVVQDYVYAHMWWNVASSHDNGWSSRFRDKIESVMTKEQIAEAQKLARECVVKDYKDC
jgi:TPR repeat protein